MKKIALIVLVFISFNSAAQTSVSESNSLLAINKPVQLLSSADYMPKTTVRNEKCINGLIVTSAVLAFAGGGCIGWPLGTALGGGDPEWALLGVGVGLVAIAIPLEIMGKKRCNGYSVIPATETIYAKQTRRVELDLVATGNSIGLKLDF